MLMNSLEENKKRIMAFFELDKLSEPKQIYIAPNRLDYQKHMEELCEGQPGWHYQDWMVADTIDGDINILNLECYRATVAHKNMDIEAYKKVVVHEFVHSCQQQVYDNSYGVGWYWEALATNLAEQLYSETRIECDGEELSFEFFGLAEGYLYANNLGKYMLKTYPHTKILEYVKEPQKLMSQVQQIIDDYNLLYDKTH